MTDMTNVVYTAKAHTTGGRKGHTRTSDGVLDLDLSPPGLGKGSNPEQLFAAGWSACFLSAMGKAAGKVGVMLPPETAIDAEVDLRNNDGAYVLQARLNVHLPGVAPEQARAIVDGAHQNCPYSKMSRGNIDVEINLV